MKIRFYIISFLVICLFACTSDDSSSERSPILAKFILPYNNTSFQKGKDLPVEIEFESVEDLESVKLFTRDTIYFEGSPQKKKLDFQLRTTNWRLGTKQISLEVVPKSGKKRTLKRMVRVLSDIYPADYTAEVIEVFPHKKSSYTQGLEFDNGNLYEGTGGMGSRGGESRISKVDYKTGEILKRKRLDDEYFGEGITIFGDKIYQLTWQQNVCFVYDKNTFEKINEFSYSGEGWGLCNNGTHLIMSDGTERLYFRDPSNFALLKTIEVYSNSGPMKMLNELEYINGKIYANIYQTNNIAVIDPQSGAVEKLIDLSLIALEYREDGDVLNGIAYHEETERIFVTGKNWPSLLHVEFVEQ